MYRGRPGYNRHAGHDWNRRTKRTVRRRVLLEDSEMGWMFGKSEKGRRDSDLLEALGSRDTARICEAADRAGEQKLRQAVPVLVPLLYSGNKRVIAAVAQALGEIGDLRAMQHLGEA